MDITYQEDVCFFVGGIGAKTGVSRAGGCTKAWLASKNGDPSALFGADGACVYSNPSIQIGTNSRITGPNGTFAGVEVGMVAFLDASDFDAGYYEVTDVGSNDEYVEFGGADEVFLPEYLPVYIGGAFSDLHAAYFNTGAWVETCHILTNKNETLASTLTLHYAGGNPQRNTYKETIGYNTQVFVENGHIISDMDPGKAAHQSALDVLQNGITAGKKVILDGSALSAIAVSWRVDNFVMRNIHIKANTGYACAQPNGGTALQYKGAIFDNCLFDGGSDGVKTNGLADYVRCDHCYSNSSSYGFNLLDANNGGKSAVLSGCIADGCVVGLAVSGSGDISGCITQDCANAVETNGTVSVTSSVLYDCSSHAFICSDVDARWHIVNTIVVLDPAADGIFGIGSAGGSIVYEDYNCFIDTAGNPVTLHDNTSWPIDYVPSLIGANSLEVNPLFVNVANADFSLQSSSPCKDSGKPTAYSGVTSMGVWQPQQVSDPGQSGGSGGRHHGRFGGTGKMQY